MQVMQRMFNRCYSFNADISAWDTSSVESFSKMFHGCPRFNGNISNWITSGVVNVHQKHIVFNSKEDSPCLAAVVCIPSNRPMVLLGTSKVPDDYTVVPFSY